MRFVRPNCIPNIDFVTKSHDKVDTFLRLTRNARVEIALEPQLARSMDETGKRRYLNATRVLRSTGSAKP